MSAASVITSTAANLLQGGACFPLGNFILKGFYDSRVTVVRAYTDFHLGVQTSDNITCACGCAQNRCMQNTRVNYENMMGLLLRL